MGQSRSKRPDVTVANDSGGVIWAKVEREMKYPTNFKGGIEGGVAGVQGGVAYDWDKIKPGYSKIANNEYMRYEVKTEEGEQVFLSIRSDEGEIYTDALPKISPCGVKVVPPGQVVDVMKGNHVWTEVSPTPSSSKTYRGTAAREMDKWNILDKEPFNILT